MSDKQKTNDLSDSDGSATPQWLFDVLEHQVNELTGEGFGIDAAACQWNAKCENYYDKATDALKQHWSEWRNIFCNPPFDKEIIGSFVQKALDAAESGSTVVLLLPSWTGYDWFAAVKAKAQMQDVMGPIRFENADGSTTTLNNGYRSSAIVIATIGPHIVPGTNGPPIRRPDAIQAPRSNDQASSRCHTGSSKQRSSVEPRGIDTTKTYRVDLTLGCGAEGDRLAVAPADSAWRTDHSGW